MDLPDLNQFPTLEILNMNIFQNNINLSSITEWDLSNCINLKEVNGFFYGNRYVTKITFPNSVETFGNMLFYNCSKLTEINIPTNLKYIGQNTFYNTSLLNKLDFSNNNITCKYSSPFAYSCAEEIKLNEISFTSMSSFNNCRNLKVVDLSN